MLMAERTYHPSTSGRPNRLLAFHCGYLGWSVPLTLYVGGGSGHGSTQIDPRVLMGHFWLVRSAQVALFSITYIRLSNDYQSRIISTWRLFCCNPTLALELLTVDTRSTCALLGAVIRGSQCKWGDRGWAWFMMSHDTQHLLHRQIWPRPEQLAAPVTRRARVFWSGVLASFDYLAADSGRLIGMPPVLTAEEYWSLPRATRIDILDKLEAGAVYTAHDYGAKRLPGLLPYLLFVTMAVEVAETAREAARVAREGSQQLRQASKQACAAAFGDLVNTLGDLLGPTVGLLTEAGAACVAAKASADAARAYLDERADAMFIQAAQALWAEGMGQWQAAATRRAVRGPYLDAALRSLNTREGLARLAECHANAWLMARAMLVAALAALIAPTTKLAAWAMVVVLTLRLASRVLGSHAGAAGRAGWAHDALAFVPEGGTWVAARAAASSLLSRVAALCPALLAGLA